MLYFQRRAAGRWRPNPREIPSSQKSGHVISSSSGADVFGERSKARDLCCSGEGVRWRVLPVRFSLWNTVEFQREDGAYVEDEPDQLERLTATGRIGPAGAYPKKLKSTG